MIPLVGGALRFLQPLHHLVWQMIAEQFRRNDLGMSFCRSRRQDPEMNQASAEEEAVGHGFVKSQSNVRLDCNLVTTPNRTNQAPNASLAVFSEILAAEFGYDFAGDLTGVLDGPDFEADGADLRDGPRRRSARRCWLG